MRQIQPIETYEIGFFIVFDESDEVVGKLVIDGLLHSLHTKFTICWNFKADAKDCNMIRIKDLFNLETDDWFGKINNAASNMAIMEVDPLPIFISKHEIIGHIIVTGTCDKASAIFIPISDAIKVKMTRIFIEDKVLDKPRLQRFYYLLVI